MSVYISATYKKLIIARADHRCEYCRVQDYLSAFDYHFDHIIAIQHGGPDSTNNLAYCCSQCNWKKGPNISTLLKFGGDLIPLFNPRLQNWFEHFEAKQGRIFPLTLIGEATIKLLELNQPNKIEERYEMTIAGFYP